MPPKAKPRKSAAPKRASAVRAKDRVQDPPAAVDVDEMMLGEYLAAGSDQGCKRRLQRRDTDDAVQRAIDSKLTGRYSEEAINGCTNINGKCVREFILEAIRNCRQSQKHLSTAFWTDFFGEFALHSVVTDNLPEPDPDEEVRAEVIEKLSACHEPNPATRTTQPLISYLGFCDDLTYVELYGILLGC